MFKLEKKIKFYKNQFDDLVFEVHQCHILDTLSIDLDSLLFRIKYMIKNNKDLHKLDDLQKEFVDKSLSMRKMFGETVYAFLSKISDCNKIVDMLARDMKIDSIYIEFDLILISEDREYLEEIERALDVEVYNLYPDKFFRFYTDSYNDGIAKAYPDLFDNELEVEAGVGKDNDIFVHNFTFQTSERCSLQCLPAGSKILMGDCSYKNIEEIVEGDTVLGFDEKKATVLIPATVTKTFAGKSKCYSIKHPYFKTPIEITGEHPVLTNKGWVNAKDITAEDNVMVLSINPCIYTKGEVYAFSGITGCELGREGEIKDVYNLETSTGTYVTDRLAVHNCTYCYQFNKSPMRMDFNVAKQFIDKLLNDEYGYINRYNSPAIILEFIGGEPLMEIRLTRKIYEYFLDRCYDMDHPWFKLHRVSICSNGLQYFDKDVQEFFRDYSGSVSFNISIDGNKELHDACRIQPNGEGSYDIDLMALNHFNRNHSPERNSKMTLAPQNMKYLFESVKSFIENGMKTINLNCIFEEGWDQKTAKLEYEELKKLADYLLENDLENLYVSVFNERQEDKQDKNMDGNFCFRGDTLVATPNGSRRIDKLEIGDFTYTASGSIHKVEYISKRHSENNFMMLVEDHLPIHCTKDHQFFSKVKNSRNRYGMSSFRKIEDLKEDDLIAVPVLEMNGNALKDDIAYLYGAFISNGRCLEDAILISMKNHKIDVMNNTLENSMLSYKTEEGYVSIARHESALNQYFYELCNKMKDGQSDLINVFKSSANAAKRFIYGFSCDREEFTVHNTRLVNDLSMLMRASELDFEYHNNIFSINKINKYNPDVYNVIWKKIISITDDTAYDVYCPTVMPIDNSKEEHTIIVNGVAAKQCGAGSASMLALRPNGQFYPCIRYMPTSVGPEMDDLCMGTVEDGLIGRAENSEIIAMMDRNTRRAQVNDICYDCPIASDCASCSALGVTVFNNNNKKVTFICIQMIAEALANVYYWNLCVIKNPSFRLPVRKNNVPDEWALLVIDQEELDFLKKLEIGAMIHKLENA